MSAQKSKSPSSRSAGLLAAALVALGAVATAIYTAFRRKRRPAGTAAADPTHFVMRESDPISDLERSQSSPTPVDAPPPAAPIGPRGARRQVRPVHMLALAAILVVGFFFRFAGLNWDDSQHQHPDERFLTSVLGAVRIPDSLGQYFDAATSPLNPRNVGYTFFVYGDFPITLGRLAAETLNGLCAPAPDAPVDAASGRPAPTAFDGFMRSLGFDTFCYRADGSPRSLTGYDELTLVGRVLSAVFDLATLVWLFLIAREVYSTRVGVLAAALGALAVLNIQQAHYFTADSFATTFVAAAFYFIVRAGKTGAVAHFVAAGVFSGLATACRINVAPILGIVLIAALARALRAWDDPAVPRGARLEKAVAQVVVAGVAAFIAFRIFMPNAFGGLLTPEDRWLDNMSAISRIVSGEASSPPDVQWTNRTPILFPWVNMVFWGLGLPLGLAAWAGWAVIGWRLLARPYLSRDVRTIGQWARAVITSKHALIWVWVTAYFAWQGSQWVKSMRYLLPLYPFMAMLAGWLLASLWDWARRPAGQGGMRRAAAYAAPVLVLAGTFLWAIAFTAIYRQPMTRVAASEWIYDRIPTAATLSYVDANGARDVQLALPNEATFLGAGAPRQVAGFRVPTGGVLQGVTIHRLADAGGAALGSQLTLVVSADASASSLIASATSGETLQADRGSSVTIEFSGEALQAGFAYYLSGYAGREGVPLAAGASVEVDTGQGALALQAQETPGVPGVLAFSTPQAGALASITVAAPETARSDLSADALRVSIALDPNAEQVLAQNDLTIPADAAAADYAIPLGGAQLEAGRQYYFVGEATGGALVAASSTLANEHWDDGLPLRIGGRDGFSIYRGLEIQNYNDDTVDKLGQLIAWLDQADYLFMTSNRLYASIPRQPLRYPLASEYYRLLFSGQLGFEQIAEFTSYPRLGPFEFPDQETTQALGLWPDPTRLPRPGVITVPYPPAEEAFSVYDHPRVILFKKRADFSLQDVIAKLSGLDLEAAYHGFTPREETSSPTGQMLSSQAFEGQQASGTWSDLYDRNSLLNTNPGVGVGVWYVVVGVLGLAAFPIVYVAVPGLADRGYGLARTLGLLLVSFLVWFPASFHALPFSREAITLMAVVLMAAGGLLARARWPEIKAFFRRNARLILVEELVFAAAFVLFLLLRYGNPDLWHPWKGGEKPMDFAYFNAVLKSQYFPPYDPWFAGGFLTYYYYGWVIFGALTKLLGIVPAIAYNFVVPTIYALAATATFSVAHGLASQFGPRVSRPGRDRRQQAANASRAPAMAVGVLAAVFVMLIGNLGEVKLIYDEVGKLGQVDYNTTLPAVRNTVDFGDGLIKVLTGQQSVGIPSDWWYWNPTRIIPAAEGEAGPITEFPFFTFLYADLHAHMMALPITILVLGMAVSWVTRVPLRRRADPVSGTPDAPRTESHVAAPLVAALTWLKAHGADVLSLALGALAVGALRATNTPDYPTYVGVGLVALAFGTWASDSLRWKETWLRFAARAGLFIGATLLLFAPFAQSDRLGGASLEGWTGSRTELWAYLFVHGIFLFPIVTYLYVELRRWGLRWLAAAWNRLGEWRWLVGIPALATLLALAYFALTGVTVVWVAVPLMVASGGLMLRPRLPAVTRLWLLMVFLALALSLAVELVVFRGDIGRMNMVFKFYYQIWVLLGIAGAVALGWLWRRLSIDLPQLNGGWRAAASALVVGGLLYVPFAARGKLSERFNAGDPPGLDGMAYMAHARYTEVTEDGVAHDWNLGWDYQAIVWMQDHIAGTPVVAEGRSRHEYLWGGRVSIYAGLPTIFGWSWHERQQRGVIVPGSVIDRRIQDVTQLYSDPSTVTAQKILQRYDVKYIVVGQLEQAYYAPDGLAKFDAMAQAGQLRLVYQNPGAKLYEVISEQ